MGHGASTGMQSSLLQRFAEVERKCNSGYYHSAPHEYQRAMEAAIETESLDFLEVLLAGGPVRTAFPAHVASSLGKVEALELILGAGFPGSTKNSEGLTPLHCAVLNKQDPSSASLCVALLCLRYPNLWKVATSHGDNALHLAAQHDQDQVLETLLQFGADPKQRTPAGLSLQDVAKKHNSHKVLAMLKRPGNGTSKANHSLHPQTLKQQYVPKPPSEVDMERIMQVWDRFFENAFKLSEGLDRAPQPYPIATDHFPSSYHTSRSSTSSTKEIDRRKDDRPRTTACNINSSRGKKDIDNNYSREASNSTYYDYSQSCRFDNDINEGDDEIAWVLEKEGKKELRSEKLMLLEEKDEEKVKKLRRNSRKSDKKSTKSSQEAKLDSRATSAWVQALDDDDDALRERQAKEAAFDGQSTTCENVVGDATYWECLDWFQHVLCYDSQQHHAYYVIHLPTSRRYWLSEYLSYLAAGALAEYYCVLHDSVESLAAYALPSNAMACAQLGWMMCFDSSSNQCFWYQLRTEATQHFLPLGQDTDERERYSSPDVLGGLPLVRRDVVDEEKTGEDVWGRKGHRERDGEESVWYGTSQLVAQSWILVIVAPKDEQCAALSAESYYYYNTLTSESQWTAPGSTPETPHGSSAWLELLHTWGSWRLCCMEDHPLDLFWYDLKTGESVWA